MKSFYHLLLLIPAIFVIACVARPPVLEEPACPVPPTQNCRPGEFTGKAIYDTVSESESGALIHYEIKRLPEPTNTRDNDLGVAFINVSGIPQAAITSDRASDTGRQAVWVFPVSRFDAFGDGQILNGFSQNGGSLAVDRATLRAFFSAPRVGGALGDYDLYYGRVERDGPGWRITSVASMGDVVNGRGTWESQPALSPDGQTLYFASDRPGGSGGTDIWFTTKKTDGTWSAPQNAGPTVNTECDEITPFVTMDGRMLYFASSGHATIGGYDLFRAPITKGTIGDAENLAAPVNTTADEIYPSSFGPADSLLYYASTQAGGAGGFDLYVLHRVTKTIIQPKIEVPVERPIAVTPTPEYKEKIQLKPMIIDTVPKPVPVKLIGAIPLSGIVSDARTHLPIPDATVTWKIASMRDSSGTARTDRNGRYEGTLDASRDYEISASAPRYFYDAKRITTPPPAPFVQPMVRNFALPETLDLRVNFPFNQADHPYDYALNDSGLKSDLSCYEEIDLLADNLKQVMAKLKQLRLIGHTDSSGTDLYNVRLGMRRAQWVKNQLVKRGIPADLIVVESRGRTQPVKRRPADTDDLFAARCRRTELLKELKD